MIFTDIFIRRPVFATTLSLLILLIGLVAYKNLQVRQYPQIDASVITINTSYPGANAQLMESFVTTPIEEQISSVDGIDYIESSSTQNMSSIQVHMKLGRDIDAALTNISSKTSSARWKLPKDINDPIISKEDPNAQAIIYLVFSSDTMSGEEVTDYLIRVIQPQLQTQEGVSQAQIMGAREYAMRIWLNPELMAAHHVTANDLSQALQSNNIQSTSGRLEENLQEFNVYATTDLQNAEQFNHLFIRNDGGRIVRIKDIGKAKLGPDSNRASVLTNGKRTTFVSIIPKSNANPLDVAKEIKAQLPQIKEHLPSGLEASVFWDSSKFISSSLKEVTTTIAEACFFVFLVIFLLIGSFRAVIVPIVTIPLSLLGACILMLALGYSINTLTLLAFVLAIGLVVDDSIVVLENIHRHLAEGLSAVQAALVGAREIAFAVITMTFTLAAVYAPIGFMKGLTGKLFTEFAFTLAFSVITSGFIALTLSPMMCSKLYNNDTDLEKGLPGLVDRLFSKVISFYKISLHHVLKLRYFIILLALIVYASCYFLYISIPSELAPTEDQGVVMTVVSGPASANLQYTETHTKELEAIYNSVPEKETYGIVNGYPGGVSSAISFMILKPWDQRTRSAMDIRNELFPKMWSIPGIKAFPTFPPDLPGAAGFTPISFVLKTTKSYSTLEEAANKLMQAAQGGGLLNIDSDLKIDQPQTIIDIHRNKASDLGINMNVLSESLNVFLGEPTMTRFNMNGRSYDVIPQLYKRFRNSPSSLNNLNVRTQSGQLVPLSNLTSLKEKIVPRSLNHFQELRSATITASLAPGLTQGEGFEYLTTLANKVLTPDIQVDYSGQLRQFVQASGQMAQTFIFAILFIYLILAAQFESFRDPLIVMLCVPLSIAGALILLLLTKSTINIYTEIGLITLVGLITKNGILIVEFANQQQEKGLAFRDAIIEAASFRLRPILMTTAAMILGAVPLALATGAGAISRRQMGLVIIGGMSFGTLLTLFVIPTAYYMFATKIKPKQPL